MPLDGLRTVGVVLALWLAGLGSAAQFAKIAVILPELGLLYPEAGAHIGFLVSLISLMGVVLGLVAGVLANRIGLRRLLLLCLALGSVVSLFQASLPSFHILLASRALEGFSHLGIVVAAPTLIALIAAPRYRALAMTLWATFFGVAFALTAIVGPPLVAQFGLSGLFAGHGLLLAATAVILMVALPRPASGDARRPALDVGTVLRRHREAYTSPHIAAPAMGWLFYTLTYVSLLTILPGLLPEVGRALFSTAAPLVGIASTMTLGLALLRWLTPVQVVMIGFAAAGTVALGFLWWPPTAGHGIALFAALGLIQGASFAAIPQLNASAGDQALSNGAVAQMGNLGNACGTPLLLALLVNAGFEAMIGGVLIAYALGLLSHALLSRRRTTSKTCRPATA